MPIPLLLFIGGAVNLWCAQRLIKTYVALPKRKSVKPLPRKR